MGINLLSEYVENPKIQHKSGTPNTCPALLETIVKTLFPKQAEIMGDAWTCEAVPINRKMN